MNTSTKSIRNLLNDKTVLKLLLAIHIIVIICLTAFSYPWKHGDSQDYLLLADSISQGNFGIETSDGLQIEGLRLPGYPVVIFLFQLIFGKHFLGLIIIQGIIYLISVILIWHLFHKYINKYMGFIFLIILIPYPFIGYASSFIVTEVWCLFLITSTVYLLVNFYNTNHYLKAIVISSILLGISFYFRANLFPLSVTFSLAIVINNYLDWRKALLFTTFCWLVILPYVGYNYMYFSRFTPLPVGSYTGVSLLQNTWQNRVSIESFTAFASDGEVNKEIIDSGMFADFQQIKQQTETKLQEHSHPDSYKKVNYQITLNSFARQKAFENIKNNPITYLKSCMTNMVRMWFATYNQSFDSIKYDILGYNVLRLLISLPGLIIFLLGFIGYWLSYIKFTSKKARLFSFIAISCILNFTLTMCWFHTESRYTIPVRLLLVAGAAISVYYLLRYLFDKFKNLKPTKPLADF